MRFETLVRNDYASEDNPHKFGVVIKKRISLITCTNCEGDYWDIDLRFNDKIEVVGCLDISEYKELTV